MKKALVIGAGGQQGSYLCELLLEKNYRVHGIIRQNDFPVCQSEGAIEYHCCEMNDDLQILETIAKVKPNEIYNLAAINSIEYSFESPIETMDINFGGLVRIVEILRKVKWDCKIYFAASSEVFGNPVESPQTETTKPNPRNPYGISKLAGWNYAKICREKYGMKIYVGIIYNNDSPRRPEEFLTRKVCKYVASVANGNKEKLKLGNLNARRDFGYSKEYVEWTYRIMQHPTPDDFCLSMDTEILTNNGWKSYDNINADTDKAISLNTNDGFISDDKIIRVINRKYKGDMYSFRGTNLDVLVTKNHRMIYMYKNGSSRSGLKEKPSHEFPLKIFKPTGDYSFPISGELIRSGKEPEISIDYIKLIGWIVGEGDVVLPTKQNDHICRLSISQSKKANYSYWREIDRLLIKLKLDYRRYDNKNGLSIWSFRANQTRTLLKFFDDNNIHRIPRKLLQYSKPELKILFDTLIKADGHFADKKHRKNSVIYSTRCVDLHNDFIELCVLLNYKFSSYKQKVKLNSRSHKWKDMFHYNIVVSFDRKPLCYPMKISSFPYNGRVWCVETQANKTIIIKRNDKVCVVGNCLATGVTHSVRDFVAAAFEYAGIPSWEKYIELDQSLFRPSEEKELVGDASKSKTLLNFSPKVTFGELVSIMMEHELKNYKA